MIGTNGFVSCIDTYCKNIKIKSFPFEILKLKAAPNPMKRTTNIVIDSEESMDIVSIDVTNSMGNKVDELYTGELNSGSTRLTWSPKNDVSNGTYFINVHTVNGTISERVILNR